MRARVENDISKGEGGYAVIHVEGWSQDRDVEYCIPKPDPPGYLSRDGWINEECWIRPDLIKLGSAGLEIHVGPDVVEHMQPDRRVQLRLRAAGGDEVSTSLFWGDIAPPFQSSGRRRALGPAAAPLTGSTPAGTPAAGGISTGEPSSATPSPPLIAQAAAMPSGEAAPQELASAPLESTPMPEPSSLGGRVVTGGAAALAGVALVAGLGWYLTRPPDCSVADLDPGAARACEQQFAMAGDALRALELRRRWVALGSARDKFELARMLDPREPELPTGDFDDDPVESRDWYLKASEAGDADVTERSLSAARGLEYPSLSKLVFQNPCAPGAGDKIRELRELPAVNEVAPWQARVEPLRFLEARGSRPPENLREREGLLRGRFEAKGSLSLFSWFMIETARPTGTATDYELGVAVYGPGEAIPAMGRTTMTLPAGESTVSVVVGVPQPGARWNEGVHHVHAFIEGSKVSEGKFEIYP